MEDCGLEGVQGDARRRALGGDARPPSRVDGLRSRPRTISQERGCETQPAQATAVRGFAQAIMGYTLSFKPPSQKPPAASSSRRRSVGCLRRRARPVSTCRKIALFSRCFIAAGARSAETAQVWRFTPSGREDASVPRRHIQMPAPPRQNTNHALLHRYSPSARSVVTHAGMTFTMLRCSKALLSGAAETRLLREQISELALAAGRLALPFHADLEDLAHTFQDEASNQANDTHIAPAQAAMNAAGGASRGACSLTQRPPG